MAKKKNNNIKQVIINVWQGKLSLIQTFWLVFVLGGTIVTLPSFILTDEFIDSISGTGAMLGLVFFIFQYSYLIWAYVGSWRSATNYKPKKGQWSWGTIAKVYIALNIIRAIVKLFQ
tara:strand:- start:103 stop:453 length:351 start_codon:yes stop_codon:yes gene_type:complete